MAKSGYSYMFNILNPQVEYESSIIQEELSYSMQRLAKNFPHLVSLNSIGRTTIMFENNKLLKKNTDWSSFAYYVSINELLNVISFARFHIATSKYHTRLFV